MEHANEQLSQKRKLIWYRGHHSILLQVETTSYWLLVSPLHLALCPEKIVSSGTSESLHTLQMKANITAKLLSACWPKIMGQHESSSGEQTSQFLKLNSETILQITKYN